ncbi:MAG: hypothetical protein QG623_696 [Patescibacteria group bacterium]|nr:hypothetical protein [Patescibacteria group bacterium]
MILSMMFTIFLGAESSLPELYGFATSFVEILSLLIGLVLVGSTIFAGIQYTTAGGDTGKVQKAKGRLASNILVLVLYMFSAAILNWLLPG